MLYEVTIKVQVEAASIEDGVHKVRAHLKQAGVTSNLNRLGQNSTNDDYRVVGCMPLDDGNTHTGI